jgi:hypothetical protein
MLLELKAQALMFFHCHYFLLCRREESCSFRAHIESPCVIEAEGGCSTFKLMQKEACSAFKLADDCRSDECDKDDCSSTNCCREIWSTKQDELFLTDEMIL